MRVFLPRPGPLRVLICTPVRVHFVSQSQIVLQIDMDDLFLDGLALSHNAPQFLLRTTRRGLPYICLLVCASFSLLAFMGVSSGAGTVFNWFSNMTCKRWSIGILSSYLDNYPQPSPVCLHGSASTSHILCDAPFLRW